MATGGQVTCGAEPTPSLSYVCGAEIQLLTFNSFHFSCQ